MKELKFIKEIFVRDNFGKMLFKVVDDYPNRGDIFKGKNIVNVKNVDTLFPNDEMINLYLITFEDYDSEWVAIEY